MSGSSIGSLAGAVIGGVVGTIINPGAGTALGISLGSFAGGLAGGLYDTLTASDTVRRQESIADIVTQTSTYGRAIPQIWGAYVVGGNVIWASSKREIQKRQSQSGKGGKKVVTVTKTYVQDVAYGLCDTRMLGEMGHIDQIWRDSTLIYDRGTMGDTLPAGWAFYPGSLTQSPDPTIEAALGVGNTPAYRSTCYAVVTNDDLGQTGQAHLYKFKVSKAGTRHMVDALTTIATYAGVPSGNVDVSTLDDALDVSFAIVNIEQARVPIENILEVFRLYAVESRLTLAFRRKGAGSVVATIPEDDLAAGQDTHAEGGLRIERRDTASLPTDLDVSYADEALGYQQNVRRFQVGRAVGLPINPRSISTALAIGWDGADTWGRAVLAEAWTEREVLSTTLGRPYATLEPGDRVTITSRGITYQALLTETSYGHPGILELTGTLDSSFTIATPPDTATPPPDWLPPIATVVDTQAVLLNLPALSASDAVPRYHVGYLPDGSPWDGASLYRSTDSEATYDQVSTHTLDAVSGTVALATPTGTTHAYDEGTTITVVMSNGGELISVDDAALEAGTANLFALGAEVLSAGTATLVATDTYELTHLLRGRRGTEAAQATHGTSERLTLLDTGVKAVTMDRPDVGVSRPYKTVTYGQDIADVTSTTFTPTAANMLPWAAQAIAAAPCDGGSWQLTWDYVPRFGGDWVTGYATGFDADHTGFAVTIYSSNTYATIKRTITTLGYTPSSATARKGTLYSAEAQIADFGAIQTTIYYRVAQLTGYGAGPASNQTSSGGTPDVEGPFPPGPPTSASATAVYRGIRLAWTTDTQPSLAAVQVWAATTNNRASATQIAVPVAQPSAAQTYVHTPLTVGDTWYYWLRSVDADGNVSLYEPASPTGGLSATVAALPPGDVKLTWEVVTATSADLVPQHGYIIDTATLCTLTLPATMAIDETIQVVGRGAGGWKIAQRAGQQIHLGDRSTTVGTGGSIQTTTPHASLTVHCLLANTTFGVLGGAA